jgi:hypothetical protein
MRDAQGKLASAPVNQSKVLLELALPNMQG